MALGRGDTPARIRDLKKRDEMPGAMEAAVTRGREPVQYVMPGPVSSIRRSTAIVTTGMLVGTFDKA